MDRAARIRQAATRGADPDGSPARVARFLAACEEHGGVDACVPDELAERLLALITDNSAWLAQDLVRDPRSLARLAADPYLTREKDLATMHGELVRLARRPNAVLPQVLRQYRRREYLRLGAREIGFGDPVEVARELSHLAAACMDVALVELQAELTAKHGEPRREDGQRCRFVVMGMGKLGGEELNFSSDIDLLYLYETDQGTVGDGNLTLHEFFARLCDRLGRAISDVTEDGFCFRIDLRLRPEGTRGPVANSLQAAEAYYESFGRPWERQAWLKARAVAPFDDLALGAEAEALLKPFVWPRSTGPHVIRHVHELMGRIRAELSQPDDIKVGPGGIREIEFFVQALQLVHGRLNAVRERGTLRALDKLLFAGLLSEREHRTLVEAYLFLRRVEHRLQLEEGRQTHLVPNDPARRALLARRLGFVDGAAFEAALEHHRQEVAAIYTTLGAAEPPPRQAIITLLDPGADRQSVLAALRELGFSQPEVSAEERDLLLSRPQSPFVHAGLVGLAAALLEDAAASPDPDLALHRLVDLTLRRGAAAEIWRLLESNRPLVRLVVSLFGTSELLSKQLIAHPELLEPLLSTAQARPVWLRSELEADVRSALTTREPAALHQEDEEARLNALRRVKREHLLRIGMFDVAGTIDANEVAGQLSDLAEVLVQAALDIVTPKAYRRYGSPDASLAVIALGKLGGRELSYASDLDVVFVYSREGTCSGGRESSHFELFSRIAQRLLLALSAFMEEGRLYEVDTRLRPSGQKGALVSSLEGFRLYHQHAAMLWERQALIKARTVAGDAALGGEIERMMQAHVYGAAASVPQGQSPGQRSIAEEIGRLRARMEIELAHEGDGRFNFKLGRGGLVDVEFLVQYLQLKEGPRCPSLRVRSTSEALAVLKDEGVLSAGEARELETSYAFLRSLENRLRIVHDRSIQELPQSGVELDKLARRVGYHGDHSGERLLADYHMHTERIRATYARYLPTPKTHA